MYSKIVDVEEANLAAVDYFLIHLVSFNQNKQIKFYYWKYIRMYEKFITTNITLEFSGWCQYNI